MNCLIFTETGLSIGEFYLLSSNIHLLDIFLWDVLVLPRGFVGTRSPGRTRDKAGLAHLMSRIAWMIPLSATLMSGNFFSFPNLDPEIQGREL